MQDEPKIYRTESQLVATLHVTVSRDEIREVMNPALKELVEAVKQQKVTITGPWFTHQFRMNPDVFDFDIGVPVESAIRADARVKPGVYPSIKVVETIYHGDYEGLGEAWEEFLAWIDSRGYSVSEDFYECYLVGPEHVDDAEQWQTRLTKPLLD